MKRCAEHSRLCCAVGTYDSSRMRRSVLIPHRRLKEISVAQPSSMTDPHLAARYQGELRAASGRAGSNRYIVKRIMTFELTLAPSFISAPLICITKNNVNHLLWVLYRVGYPPPSAPGGTTHDRRGCTQSAAKISPLTIKFDGEIWFWQGPRASGHFRNRTGESMP